MAHVTELGSRLYFQRLYWHSDSPPLLHLTVTQEIEAPFREGRCLVVRIPFTKRALVFGRWVGKRRQLDALLAATGGRITKDNGITAEELEEW
jgi:hypothetical protein